MDSTPRKSALQTLRDVAHPRCFACSPSHEFGLKLHFEEVAEGVVRASFDCASVFEGYPGLVHGGIICTILDSALANCLFARQYQGVTAELTVKFRAPVVLKQAALVEAKITRDLFPLFLMEASLSQGNEAKATATAKFIIPQGL